MKRVNFWLGVGIVFLLGFLSDRIVVGPNSVICVAKGGKGGGVNSGGGAGGAVYLDASGICHAYNGEDGKPGKIDFYKRLDKK